MSRPAHLAIRAGAPIVKASRELGSGLKLVWLELLELDRGGDEGAWLSAPGLAERVGLGREAVEAHRRELRALGLLAASRTPTGQACWYPTLPDRARPASARRPDVDEIARLARSLDADIRMRRAGVAHYATEAGPDASAPAPPRYASKEPGVTECSTPRGDLSRLTVPARGVPPSEAQEGGDKEGGESPASPPSPASTHATASVSPRSSLPPREAGEDGVTADRFAWHANAQETGEEGGKGPIRERRLATIAKYEAQLACEVDPTERHFLELAIAQHRRALGAEGADVSLFPGDAPAPERT